MDFSTPSPTPTTTTPCASAILLAIFSLLLALLILPPLLWHLTNRNIGASSLILWLLLLNLQNALNALLWRHDATQHWYNGSGLCDVQVKFMMAAYVGVPASVACVLKALARVLDTEKTTLGLTKGQRRRGCALDLVWCVGFPALQMLAHYVVQTRRYYIVGIAGCLPAVSNSWVTDALIIAPPIVWACVGGYYAALILIRLHRYRRTFSTLLANSNTNRSRFVRLFAICLIWLVLSIPLQAFVISHQAAIEHIPFSWSAIHDPVAWQVIEMMPSGGNIVYTRYIWLGAAFMVFMFFGFGRDAGGMYAKWLRAVGLGGCLAWFSSGRQNGRGTERAGSLGSVGSKARLLFGRRSQTQSQSARSWGAESRSSKGTASTDMNEPLSPKTMQHLETVRENSRAAEQAGNNITSRLPVWLGGRRRATASDLEKGMSPTINGQSATQKQSSFYRLTSPFRSMAAVHGAEAEPVSMNSIMRRQDVTVHSTVAAGRSGSADSSVGVRDGGKKGVLVRKEVRQGSEVAGGDPELHHAGQSAWAISLVAAKWKSGLDIGWWGYVDGQSSHRVLHGMALLPLAFLPLLQAIQPSMGPEKGAIVAAAVDEKD
ncbi:hypothetical protein Q7P37_003338 [Cladosporium fusiforme]